MYKTEDSFFLMHYNKTERGYLPTLGRYLEYLGLLM